MPEFEVHVVANFYRSFSVEADTIEEAEDMAMEEVMDQFPEADEYDVVESQAAQ